MLTQERVKELFKYRDGKLYWRKTTKYNVRDLGREAGWTNKIGYVRLRVDGIIQHAHRVIYLMHHGYLPEYIDHIDGVRDNNRIENLRPCTSSQNNINRGASKKSTSIYKGVSWNKVCNKWSVTIRSNGKTVRCGMFTNETDAAMKYDEMALSLHGEFAWLNRDHLPLPLPPTGDETK